MFDRCRCIALQKLESLLRHPSEGARSSRADFRLRNPSSPDVVLVMKALFSILDPQNRVETNTCFVFAHDFVLAVRYLLFFFVAYLYYRLHKISAMPPFHGWPITTTT